MNELAKDAAATDVTDLLTRYSFDLGGLTVERLVNSWLHQYPTQWLRLAVIEALYQGRYKAFSVEQILNLWKRRGRSLYRFNHEFERIICGRFPTTTHLHRSASLNSLRSQPFYRADSPSSSSIPSSAGEDSPPFASSIDTVPNSENSADSESLFSTPAPEPASLPVESPTSTESAEPAKSVESSDSVLPMLAKPNSVPPFKPASSVELGILEIGNSRAVSHREPIHQFTPTSESSEFYSKLRAVAQIQN